MKTYRSSRWALIMYEDRMDIQFHILAHLDFISHYAISPIHDKDYKDDGSLKEKHVHVLITTYYSVTAQNLINKVFSDYKSNIFSEKIIDKYSAFEYLTHTNQQDKTQYDPRDLLSDSMEFWSCDNDNLEELDIIDAINSNVPLRDLIKIYGRKVIYHYNQYYEMAIRIKTDKLKNKKE